MERIPFEAVRLLLRASMQDYCALNIPACQVDLSTLFRSTYGMRSDLADFRYRYFLSHSRTS
jgi:hypothetical protein